MLEFICSIRSRLAHGRKAIKSFVYKVLRMNRAYANSSKIQIEVSGFVECRHRKSIKSFRFGIIL